MDKKITFENEEIEYNISSKKIYYKYKGIESSAVEILQPETHEKIISQIKEVDEEYKKIQKEKEYNEKNIKLIEMNKKQEEFLNEVRNLEIVKNYGFTIKKNVITNIYDSIKIFSFKEDLGSNYIVYVPNVSTNWGRNRTNKVWKLNFDYKNTRYVKLESAIIKYIEKIKFSIAKKIKEEETEKKIVVMESAIENFCGKNGFEYKKEFNRHLYTKRIYYIYKGIKDNKKIELTYNEETRVVSIISIYISKPTKEEIFVIMKKY